MDLAVIGLGKLGLPLACLQAQHHRVFGIDTTPETVRLVNHGISPIVERGIVPLLKEVINSGQLTAHSEYSVVTGTDLSLVIVPTPSKDSGEFSSAYVVDAVRQIGKAVRTQDNRHVVVVCSTVMPGTCDGIVRETLEMASRKRVGEDIGLIYSPEFIALGTVIEDMKNPAMTLIGESDELSGATYARLAVHDKPVRFMGLTSAEIAKIALNAYVTMKISFANVLGELCESYVDADATDISQAIGLDPRVGRQYVRPGGPYGGPCFPRDNRAFTLVGENVGVSMPLAKATDEINDRQIDRVVRHLASYPQRTVGILGLSYKPGAPISEESFGVKLAEELIRRDYRVKVYDHLIKPDKSLLPDEVTWADLPGCVGDDIVTIIAIPDPAIISQFPIVFSGDKRNRSTVVDCWNCLPAGPWDETNVVRMNRYIDAA